MMLEYDILTKDIGVVYEMGTSNKDLSLIVRTPKQIAAQLNHVLLPSNNRLISIFREKLKLPDFITPDNKQWGYGEIMESTESDDPDWVSWKCQLPSASDCSGIKYSKPHAYSATLNLFFRCIDLMQQSQQQQRQQLLHPKLTTEYGLNGGSFSVVLAARIISFLTSFPNESHHPVIEKLMQGTYEHMMGRESYYRNFQVRFRQPKGVYFSCPGNACSLDPDHYYNGRLDRGYKLLPHNIDNPVQQMTLLAGIAMLYDEARQAEY